eukprot:scaffold81349_cov18-Tisochrysis_lutea.AAC.2
MCLARGTHIVVTCTIAINACLMHQGAWRGACKGGVSLLIIPSPCDLVHAMAKTYQFYTALAGSTSPPRPPPWCPKDTICSCEATKAAHVHVLHRDQACCGESRLWRPGIVATVVANLWGISVKLGRALLSSVEPGICTASRACGALLRMPLPLRLAAAACLWCCVDLAFSSFSLPYV